MIKRERSLIAALVASLTICAVTIPAKQVHALVNRQTGEVYHDPTMNKSQQELIEMGLIDPNYHSIYAGGGVKFQLDADGNVTEESRKRVFIHHVSCHLYQKIDEASLRTEAAGYGIDFDDLVSKERPQVKRMGWVLNSHNRWYYSSNGTTWVSGWLTLGGETYFFGEDPTEYAYTGWNKINGVWYHFDNTTCGLDRNKTVDGYWVNEQGQALSKAD